MEVNLGLGINSIAQPPTVADLDLVSFKTATNRLTQLGQSAGPGPRWRGNDLDVCQR
jgi:hypothetical protein